MKPVIKREWLKVVTELPRDAKWTLFRSRLIVVLPDGRTQILDLEDPASGLQNLDSGDGSRYQKDERNDG